MMPYVPGFTDGCQKGWAINKFVAYVEKEFKTERLLGASQRGELFGCWVIVYQFCFGFDR
jgi:hypothetical protein